MMWHEKTYTFFRNARTGPSWSAIGPNELNGDDWHNSPKMLVASLKAAGKYEDVYEQEGIVFARTAVDEATQTYRLVTFMKAQA